jgi:hypothetical protein
LPGVNVETKNRYVARTNALDDLRNLIVDIEVDFGDADDVGKFIVENAAIASNHKSTAHTLKEEGRNLLYGKPEDIQKLGGGLLRIHFTNEELTQAAGR